MTASYYKLDKKYQTKLSSLTANGNGESESEEVKVVGEKRRVESVEAAEEVGHRVVEQRVQVHADTFCYACTS